jgi:hypothetical protein
VTLHLHPRGLSRTRSLRTWHPSLRTAGDTATFSLRGYPHPSDPVRKSHRAASFYVDFDEPPVAALRGAIEAKYGAHPTPAQLATFVDGHLIHKSMRRLLDPASVSARRQEGDCTEHAVLLAAVARLFGFPARIIQGLAVVEHDGAWQSLGHAWTEIHDGKGWALHDATHPPAGRVLYLPLSTIEDEGPGFAGAAAGDLSPIDVASVELAP